MLGPLRVVVDGGVADIGSPTQRVVLATLLARLGQVVPIDVLADAVWEDAPPASAVNTLRSQISRLRRVVGGRLEGSADGYSLVLAPGDHVDAPAFDHALRAAREHGDVGALVGAAGGLARAGLRRAGRHARGAGRGPAPRAGPPRRHRARRRRRPRGAPVHGGRRGVRGRRRRRRRPRAVVGDPRAGARPCRPAGRGPAGGAPGRRPRCATPASCPGSTCAAPSARRSRRRPSRRPRRRRRRPPSPCHRRR